MKFWCVFDIAAKEKEIEKLQKEASAPDFWNDQNRAQTHMRQLSSLEDQVGDPIGPHSGPHGEWGKRVPPLFEMWHSRAHEQAAQPPAI